MEIKTRAIKRVCVFCGAMSGKSSRYKHMASALGRELAINKIDLVYGGGNVGLMGVVANAVLAGGGFVTGVIPKSLKDRELGHEGISELKVVDTMHQRKAMMSELADAFIAMPGGFGTLEELFEIITWLQLGVHSKPCAILNVDDFYQSLLDFIKHMSEEGFLTQEDRGFLIVETDPEKLIARIRSFTPAPSTKWLAIEQT